MPPEVTDWITKNLFEHAPLSIAVVDPQLRVLDANSNFIAVFGDPAGRACHEVYKKSAAPCPGCAMQRTLRDGKSRISEEQGLDCIGQQAHYMVHHSPVSGTDGAVTHVVNMSYDITDRKNFQHQYNLIFERAPCALSVINKDFFITRANDHVRERFGEPTGAHCFELYKQRTTRCEECPALQTLADGKQHTSEQIRRASDGSYTYHVVSTAPLPFGDREISHVIEMSLDVTETHRLAQKLLETERLATVGQTVAQLAHSIKNILTGLQGGIYDIKTGQQRGDHTRSDEGLQTLERNYRRITALVHDFLRFSKEHRPEVVLTDPGAVAREIYTLFRKIAEKHGIDLALQVSPGIAPAWIDPRGLHTCLSNLVTNAFDACRKVDGAGCAIALRVAEQEGVISFEVEDNGCGMDRTVQDKIFRGIFTTKGPSGTGLGLVMTKKIVADHGGSIEVRSAPGQGALFRIELPRARLPVPEGAEGAGGESEERRTNHG